MREEEKEGKEEDKEGVRKRERMEKGDTQRRGDRGRGGQTCPYTQTVSLTINSYYYYIITIGQQRQCIEI